MQSLYDLIITITESPELYIGKKSIQRFYAFIGGFLHQNNGADDHCLNGFQEYVAEHYGIRSSHSWASIIEFYSNSGEEEMALFKKLFHAFTQNKTAGLQETNEGNKDCGGNI